MSARFWPSFNKYGLFYKTQKQLLYNPPSIIEWIIVVYSARTKTTHFLSNFPLLQYESLAGIFIEDFSPQNGRFAGESNNYFNNSTTINLLGRVRLW